MWDLVSDVLEKVSGMSFLVLELPRHYQRGCRRWKRKNPSKAGYEKPSVSAEWETGASPAWEEWLLEGECGRFHDEWHLKPVQSDVLF
jgi:hypothetical protein